MRLQEMHDTIVAVSTAIGKSALSVLRLSGTEAIDVILKVFSSNKIIQDRMQLISNQSSAYRRVYYGRVIDPDTGAMVDEVLVLVMSPPYTFTGELIVEINCHGGELIACRLLALLQRAGARLAQPGEFTHRAYLNGRINLTQAEAIHQMITARHQWELSWAASHLESRFSDRILQFKQQLMPFLAHLEVHIDYPEEDISDVDSKQFIQAVHHVSDGIRQILKDTQSGRPIQEGVRLAIIGKTNVGKSSLFNALSKEDRAIVSSIHGTTRDFIENVINIQGIPVQIIDTAGFRQTEDPIEIFGKQKAQLQMHQADYLLWLLDVSRPWHHDDEILYQELMHDSELGKKLILVVNKIDLPTQLDLDCLQQINYRCLFFISVSQKLNLERLEEQLFKTMFSVDGDIQNTLNHHLMVCNLRQECLLEKALSYLNNTEKAFINRLPFEMIALDLKDALNCFAEVVGEVTSDDILEQIFSQFCVGK